MATAAPQALSKTSTASILACWAPSIGNDYEEEDANEDERDRNLYGARLRTGYFISPRINTFLQGGYEREQRDASNRSQRDNNVYSAGVGTAIDFTGLLFGEAVVGWATQEFDDFAVRRQ